MIGIMNEFEWMVDVGNRVYVTKPSQLFVGDWVSMSGGVLDISDEIGVITQVDGYVGGYFLIRFNYRFSDELHNGNSDADEFDTTNSSWFFEYEDLGGFIKVYKIN